MVKNFPPGETVFKRLPYGHNWGGYIQKKRDIRDFWGNILN